MGHFYARNYHLICLIFSLFCYHENNRIVGEPHQLRFVRLVYLSKAYILCQVYNTLRYHNTKSPVLPYVLPLSGIKCACRMPLLTSSTHNAHKVMTYLSKKVVPPHTFRKHWKCYCHNASGSFLPTSKPLHILYTTC